jgi:hypothetical protein
MSHSRVRVAWVVIMIVIAYKQRICSLQKLQMSRHAVDNALGAQNTQHRPATAGNLSATSILDDARAESQAHGLGLQQEQIFLRLDLQRDLCLAVALPPAQDGGFGRVRVVVFVTGEGCVGGLRGDFA